MRGELQDQTDFKVGVDLRVTWAAEQKKDQAPPIGAPRPASNETRTKPGRRGASVPRLSSDWSAHKRCPSCGPGPSSPASSLALHAQGSQEYDAEEGAWREFYSLSQQQLPHPSEGPILPAKARAKSTATRGYGMTPKAKPAPTATAPR